MFSGRVLLLLPLALGSLVACGDDDPPERDRPYAEQPVAQIAEDTGKANESVTSVRVRGGFVLDGKRVRVDLSIAGEDCRGTMETKGEGVITLIHVGKTSYFKADQQFWRTQVGDGDGARTVLDRIGDRWSYDSSDPDGFSQLCHADIFLGAIDSAAFAGPGAKVTGTAQVAGRDTVAISYPSGKKTRGRAWISTAAPHYLVKVVEKGKADLVFRDFDQEILVEKPAGGRTFDLHSLGR